MNAVAMTMPVFASVIAFITYSATGHTLEPSVVFASLTLFNLLRLPLMFLRQFFSFFSTEMIVDFLHNQLCHLAQSPTQPMP